jgi:SPOR domain
MNKFLLLLFLCFCYGFITAQTTGTNSKSPPTKTVVKKKKKKKKKISEEAQYEEWDYYGKNNKGKKGKHGKGMKNPNIMKGSKDKPILFKPPPPKNGKPIIKNGKMLTGNISSRSGFRICIYNGTNREEAMKVKQTFSTNNPKLSSYMSYNRPNYRIRVGDFENKKTAQQALKKLLKTYPSAFIAPDIVTTKNIQVKKTQRKNTINH